MTLPGAPLQSPDATRQAPGGASGPMPRASAPARIAALLTALVAGAITLALSAGVALAAPVGMGGAALVQQIRRRRYTRVPGWVGAVAGTSVAFAALMAFGSSQLSPRDVEQSWHRAIAEQHRHPPRIQRTLQRLSPAGASAPAIQARTDSLFDTPPFIWGTIVIGGVLGSVLFGVIVGTAAWGVIALGQLGVTGRWPPRAERAPSGADDPA